MAVNIYVDALVEALLGKSRQTTQVNRQIAQENNNKKKVEAEASRKRLEKFEVEGRDAQGNVRRGSAESYEFQKQKPAAFRDFGQKIYFGPNYQPYVKPIASFPYYTEYQSYFLIDGIKKKGAGTGSGSLQLDRNYYVADYYIWESGYGVGSFVPSFVAGAGPGGKNSLLMEQFLQEGSAGGGFTSYGAGFDDTMFEDKVTCEGFFRFTDDMVLRIGNLYVKFYQEGIFVSTSSFGYGTSSLLSLTALDFENWTHLAFTFQGTVFKFYCNGQLSHSLNTFDTSRSRTIEEMSLGGYPYLATEGATYLFGEVSSIRTVNKILYNSNFTPPASIS